MACGLRQKDAPDAAFLDHPIKIDHIRRTAARAQSRQGRYMYYIPRNVEAVICDTKGPCTQDNLGVHGGAFGVAFDVVDTRPKRTSVFQRRIHIMSDKGSITPDENSEPHCREEG